MISFGTKYWFFILLIIIALASAAVFILYFTKKTRKEIDKNQRYILGALRFCSFFLVGILLLSPFVRHLKKMTQNPLVLVAWDNSSSMLANTDSLEVKAKIEQLQSDVNTQLGQDFEVIHYRFGEKSENSDQLKFTEKTSDYSELLETINNNHFNQNIGALIIAGDGIYNRGKNPVNLVEELNFPIFTVGFGDTTIFADARIQNITVNRTAFSGNKFPIEIDVQFQKLAGKRMKLSVVRNNKELESQIISVENNNYFVSKEFILDAGEAGLKHYAVKIEVAETERNTNNNTTGFVINVLESKQKILILSEGSHPDVGAIKRTLEQQKTFDVSVFTREPYPADLRDFNLLVLNQLPSSGKSMKDVIEKAQKAKLPILFIIGNQSFLPQLNALAMGAKISPLAGNGETAQASLNTTYATFNLSEDVKEFIPKLPPLQVPFADFELGNDFNTLLYQRLKNIETGKPLLATGKLNGKKTGFIFGEGIWRWRLFEYYQHQNHSRFSELISQLVQYLALRENEDNFMINYSPSYNETDDVTLKAELYNDNFERINTEEVNIELKNSNNEDFQFTFDVQGENYLLNAGHLPKGDYSFVANAKIGDETYTENGSFTVIPVDIENVITQARHNLLYLLAAQSGGQFFTPNQSTELINAVANNKTMTVSTYYQEMINEMLNLRWLFFVVLVLLGTEWFLRKFWGIY